MRTAIDRARHGARRTGLAAAMCGSMLMACSDATDPNAGRAITELNGPTAAVSVGQGFSTKSIVSIRRSSSFTGAVTLAAVGLPQGLLVSFSPATLDGVSELSEMTISALSTIAPGAHSFTVRASGDGVEAKTLNVQVNVTLPAITLVAQTKTANVAQGSTQAIPLTITREGGFTGIVGLAALGLPPGVTATFSKPALQPGETESTLTLSAPLTAQTGAKSVTLRATAQGLADKTVPIDLTIGPATTPAVLVSAAPAFLEVVSGQTVETTLTLQRFAGFNGAVDVTLEGLPVQLTASADPFAPGSNTTLLRVTARDEPAGSPFFGGSYQLSVRANGQGVQQASAGLAVTVRLQPQFTLFFSGGSSQTSSSVVTLTRGSNLSVVLNISRFQFSQPVSLTITGLPAGVTANLPTTIPASSAAQAFTIELNAAGGVVPGAYTVVIRGESAPAPARNALIFLTVH